MKQAIISHEIPSIFEKLKQRFHVSWDNVIIAFGGKIHSKTIPQPQKLVHELVHLDEQAKIGNDAWWIMYLESDIFRLEQETLAYKAEADFIKKNIKNREHRFQFIRDIADSFSSETYGSIISKQEALQLLL